MSEYQWKDVSVVGFDELMEALERADRKGYMPDAVKEAWEGFNWKPAQQEPVAWLHPANATCVTTDPSAYLRGIPLYTTPQPAQRTWVGLTEDEQDELVYEVYDQRTRMELAIGIEAKLKEKNT